MANATPPQDKRRFNINLRRRPQPIKIDLKVKSDVEVNLRSNSPSSSSTRAVDGIASNTGSTPAGSAGPYQSPTGPAQPPASNGLSAADQPTSPISQAANPYDSPGNQADEPADKPKDRSDDAQKPDNKQLAADNTSSARPAGEEPPASAADQTAANQSSLKEDTGSEAEGGVGRDGSRPSAGGQPTSGGQSDPAEGTGENGSQADEAGQSNAGGDNTAFDNQEDVYDEPGNEPSEKSDKPSAEKTPPGPPKQDDPRTTKNNLAQQEENPSGTSFYRPSDDSNMKGSGSDEEPGYSKGSSDKKIWSKLTGSRARIAASGGVATAIISFLIFGFFASLPLELVHIKNVFYSEIGGVQSRTYQIGREKYYSRMFFFDKDGNFTGYKKQGIRGMMYENRQTKKMVQALEKNGYQIEFEKVNGKETGRIKSLTKVDSNGKTLSTIASSGDLERAWDIKKSGALPNILQEVYPDKSARWNGRQAKKLYRRWDLTRTNWVSDYLKSKTGVTALEKKELAFRAALRQHLFGTPPTSDVQPGQDNAKTNDKAQNDADTAELTDKNKVAKDIEENAAKEAEKELADVNYTTPTPTLAELEKGAENGLKPDKIAENAAKSVPSSITGALTVTGVANKACAGKSALDSIVIGARVLRAAQLMKFGMSILNIADAVQNGKGVTTQDVNLVMSHLNSTDDNDKTMLASSGWQYWTDPVARNNFSFANYDKDERNRYSVGGGFTGTLASIDATLNKYGGTTGCKITKNPLVQVGGFIVGIGAGILSLGTFTATNLALNVAVGVVEQTAVSIAEEMLTPIVAGTVVNGAEHGTAIGNSLVSGLETLSNANGANAGMMPLTTGQYKVAMAGVESDNQQQIAQMSLKDRLFSADNDHSITMIAVMGIHQFNAASIFRSPFTAMAKMFNGSFLGKAAASGGDGCTDPDITGHDLAATPFCNIEVGIPDSMLNDPAYYPDVVDQKMVDGGYVDEDGNPISQDYKDYLSQCTSDGTSGGATDNRSIDIVHKSDQNEYTTECQDHPLFNMYRFYTYIGQTENDGLTGNNISDNSATASTAPTSGASTTASTAPITGDAKSVAADILKARSAGHISFNILNPADTLDGSTPEANIQDTAAGRPAKTTSNCLGRGALPPVSSVALNTDLLRFLLDLSSQQNITVNALAGQCHSTSTSNHYQGKAVDFNCPFSTAIADAIGKKYGVSHNFESCSADAHYHYSVGGN